MILFKLVNEKKKKEYCVEVEKFSNQFSNQFSKDNKCYTVYFVDPLDKNISPNELHINCSRNELKILIELVKTPQNAILYLNRKDLEVAQTISELLAEDKDRKFLCCGFQKDTHLLIF